MKYILLVLTMLVAGQTADIPAAKPDAEPRDPTVPSAALQAQLQTAAQTLKPPTTPTITLRALVAVKGRAPTALIEIDGGALATVVSDQQLAVTAAGTALRLRIVSVTPEQVEIEMTDLHRTIVLR
ncbi:MAG: hypothetical protein GC162_19050 [Planctomycetes bacterium]|nr:hypothetical protein [Planctomycetota bacterium]